jgi:hypothetical protein
MENEVILLLRCRLALDTIFRNPDILVALANCNYVSDATYEMMRETWYMLSRMSYSR